MDSSLLHAVALTRIKGLTQAAAMQLLRRYGTAEELWLARHDLPEKWARLMANTAEAEDRASAELAFCEKHGIQVLPYGTPAYPTLLADCPDAPAVLFYQGTANLNARHVISVVGTRHVSSYGQDFCQEFCAQLASLLPDCLIVSGLAYGVDIAVHRGALRNGLSTVAVLAHGLDRIYPALHRQTAIEMLRHGGLLTEYLTGTAPDKGNFVRRNRIVAGIASATLVVESADHGGALITANLACGYNREVFAVPGRINDPYSAGCNRLIRTTRAGLVTSAADVVEMLGWSQPSTVRPAAIQRELFPELDEDQQRIADLLKDSDDYTADRLAIATNMPSQQLAEKLFDMEMQGVVRLLPGGRYHLIG